MWLLTSLICFTISLMCSPLKTKKSSQEQAGGKTLPLGEGRHWHQSLVHAKQTGAAKKILGQNLTQSRFSLTLAGAGPVPAAVEELLPSLGLGVPAEARLQPTGGAQLHLLFLQDGLDALALVGTEADAGLPGATPLLHLPLLVLLLHFNLASGTRAAQSVLALPARAELPRPNPTANRSSLG